jgi:transposase-like protein
MKDKKKNRSFSKEFKKELVDKINCGEATMSQISALHNIRVNMLSRWKRELREGELDTAVEKAPKVEQMGVDPKYVRGLEQKLREANEKLGELYIVVEGLKKVREGIGFTKNANSYIVSGQPLAQSKRRVG